MASRLLFLHHSHFSNFTGKFSHQSKINFPLLQTVVSLRYETDGLRPDRLFILQRLTAVDRKLTQLPANMKTSTGAHPGTISCIPKNPPPNTSSPRRTVQIGYRPVGGRAVTWTLGILNDFMMRLGNMGIRTDDRGPNPHHHWCVIVGRYYHHAQIANGLMWYENEEISWKDGWSLFDVGETTFNDGAIVEAALRTLQEIPESYDLWSNNCHHFALRLIANICPSGHMEFSKSTRYHRRSSSMQLVDEEMG